MVVWVCQHPDRSPLQVHLRRPGSGLGHGPAAAPGQAKKRKRGGRAQQQRCADVCLATWHLTWCGRAASGRGVWLQGSASCPAGGWLQEAQQQRCVCCTSGVAGGAAWLGCGPSGPRQVEGSGLPCRLRAAVVPQENRCQRKSAAQGAAWGGWPQAGSHRGHSVCLVEQRGQAASSRGWHAHGRPPGTGKPCSRGLGRVITKDQEAAATAPQVA